MTTPTKDTDSKHIEIRGMPEPEDRQLHNREYLVTVGNLFGSQTVRAYGEDKLFELLRATSATSATSTKHPKLPAGCSLVETEAQAS